MAISIPELVCVVLATSLLLVLAFVAGSAIGPSIMRPSDQFPPARPAVDWARFMADLKALREGK